MNDAEARIEVEHAPQAHAHARGSGSGDHSPHAARSNERLLVLYDGDCGFCAWALSWILRWDRARLLRPAPIQSEEGQRALAAVPQERRLASWHALDARGELRSGGDALPALFGRLPFAAPLAALAARFPVPAARAYGWVAGHRTPLGRLVPGASKRRARALIAARMH
jgi:predicted DCC family thiol-disulfide oxidoreductase YuxK